MTPRADATEYEAVGGPDCGRRLSIPDRDRSIGASEKRHTEGYYRRAQWRGTQRGALPRVVLRWTLRPQQAPTWK